MPLPSVLPLVVPFVVPSVVPHVAPRRLPHVASLLFLLALILLTGCATQKRLESVRGFAAGAPTLSSYAELSQRYRDTYQREQPYLTAAADQREKQLDAKRRDAYPDFVAIHHAVVTYMRALGALAGDGQYDMGGQIKEVATNIKTWPDAGITDSHVNAYAGLARLLARYAGAAKQDDAVLAMLREGYQPMQASLDAMSTVLRHYDKTHDNERAIVLGMLDVEIPFANEGKDRLLGVLARAHRQDKATEYRLLGLRHSLAARHVNTVREQYQALTRDLGVVPANIHVAAPAGPAVPSNSQGATP